MDSFYVILLTILTFLVGSVLGAVLTGSSLKTGEYFCFTFTFCVGKYNDDDDGGDYEEPEPEPPVINESRWEPTLN